MFTESNQCFPNVANNTENVIMHEGTFYMLLNLKSWKASGPDNFPNVFLCRYAEWLSPFLLVISCTSISCGIVPSNWRVVRVVWPGFTDKLSPHITKCILCKLLEHIITIFMEKFREKHNILSSFQHGFCKRLSATTLLLSTVHAFVSVLDKASQIDFIFLDFSKPFDRVSFYLITKLGKYCFSPDLVNSISRPAGKSSVLKDASP